MKIIIFKILYRSTPNLSLGVDKWGDGSKFEGQWEVNKISGLGVIHGLTVDNTKEISNGFDRERGMRSRIEIAN